MGAVTVTVPLYILPLNVKLWAVEAEPVQAEKAVNDATEVLKETSLSVMEPVPDLLPTLRISVSVGSGVTSSIVLTVMVKLLTLPGTVKVPSPLSVTPFEKAKIGV